MVWLKKVNPNWTPSENRTLQVGEIIEFNAPFEQLVKEGTAILVDENGSELELPGQEFVCPICFEKTEGVQEFLAHVTDHAAKQQDSLRSQIKETEEKIEESKKDVIAIAEAEEKMKAAEEKPSEKKTEEKKKK